MLTFDQLLALHQSLEDKPVLSVYLAGSATDPAMQRARHLELEHALDDLERSLQESCSAERADLAKCRGLLEASLRGAPEARRTPGWAGFATPAGIAATLALPVAVQTQVAWSKGATLGPYLRALRETRDVIVAIADARHATIYRYNAGTLARVERIRSHHPAEHGEHMGAPARDGFHPGTRGGTARDSAQAALRYGRDRMLTEAAARVAKLAEPDAWIIVAGTDPIVSKLVTRLNGLAPGRVGRAEAIDVHSSQAEIAAAAARNGSALSTTADLHRLAELAEAAGAHGFAVFGSSDAEHTLKQNCVRALYLTPRYIAHHAVEAERAIRSALDQSASVHEVVDEAASLLDERGGIAAALRFRPPTLWQHEHPSTEEETPVDSPDNEAAVR